MTNAFTTIGLIGKYADASVGDCLKSICAYLQDRGLRVILDEHTATLWPRSGLETGDYHLLGARCDLAIVIGGDGTLLNAARALADFGVPLLGVNLGRLGFLTDVSSDETSSRLGAILSGDYLSEERFLLHAGVVRAGRLLHEGDALNDVVIHKWETARMIECETHVNGRFVNTHRSDGVIVATPTGSTAYALSGGGPIVHPTLDAIVLVPICPHTLSNRPIVVSAASEIEIVLHPSHDGRAQMTCDGQVTQPLLPGDRVVVRKKERRIRLIHPRGYDYFDILRAKLRWGGHP